MITPLSALIGVWTGEGLVSYPNMEDTPYRECLVFQSDENNSLLQYEQKTWRVENDQQSHWEFGFLRPMDELRLEMFNTQSGGRVEVSAGEMQAHANGVTLALTSLSFGNDARIVSAKRELRVENDRLHYALIMETQTTGLTVHLKASLERAEE